MAFIGSSAIIFQSIGVGTCYHPDHETPIPMIGRVVTGSSKKSINTLGAAQIGDIVLGNCGHIGILSTGSSKVSVSNKGQCTVGSNFNGDFVGVLITGVFNHNTGW